MRPIAFALFASACFAAPASAQIYSGAQVSRASAPPIWDNPHSEPAALRIETGVGADLLQIRSDIRDGRNSGQLSRREARELRRQGHAIAGMERRFRDGGLSAPELAELRTRVALLRDDLIAARSGSRD
ncbi:hypothetical protein [Sphingosinithalassobacter portus]|uniref:hypothetical protein n=1 Tax=Stakelama portus TaxID=2676234 RepID=UPI0011AB84AB|nr:hypothetical protein [Sphingosinithalassobacter portus]